MQKTWNNFIERMTIRNSVAFTLNLL